jgi:hypothetical protein
LKKASLRKRIKQIEKEISALDGDIDSLRRTVGNRSGGRRSRGSSQGTDLSVNYAGYWEATVADAESRETKSTADAAGRGKARGSRSRGRSEPRRVDDKRFADYLSSSFQSVRPLRHERRIQRNKAIVMAVLALLMLYWVLHVFF